MLEKVKEFEFLRFNFVEFATERDLLAETDELKKELIQQTLALYKVKPNKLGITKSTVCRCIKIAAKPSKLGCKSISGFSP